MYPVYATCIDLDIPIIVNAGIAGPRFPSDCQHVERFDRVCYDFPELRIVMRHGAEPWEELAVKLMLKWPGLYYMTSAFAPKYYPKAIIDYANTRGADKIMYAGYYPMGLSLERIFSEMPDVPFRDHVWPKFLRENAIGCSSWTSRETRTAPARDALHAHLGRHPRRREPRAVPRVPRPEYRDEFDAWRDALQEPVPGPPRRRRGRNWDDERRFDEQEADGTVGRGDLPQHRAAVLPDRRGDRRPADARGVPAAAAPGIRAHNRWLADFCAVAPERRAGIAQIFLNDVDEAIADVPLVAEHGLRGGVLLPGRPDDCRHRAAVRPRVRPAVGGVPGPRRADHHHSGQGSPDYGKHPAAHALDRRDRWFSHRPLDAPACSAACSSASPA